MLTVLQHSQYSHLLDLLSSMKRVLVAFSGGVDSTLLLQAAHEALGNKVLAVTFATPYIPSEEVVESVAIAHKLNVEHRLIKLPIPDILRNNPPDRCYLCKKLLFTHLLEIANNFRIEHILDGSNLDDLDDYRPGQKAVKELGIKSPLLEAGMSKQDIRDISKYKNLPTWDLPAGACLLTRLPHKTKVKEEDLSRIDEGEQYLHSLGFRAVRLRSHGEIVRIEIPRHLLGELVEADKKSVIHSKLKDLGYLHVCLDLEGYRMGSLNKGPKK